MELINNLGINFEGIFLDFFNSMSVNVNKIGGIASVLIGSAVFFYFAAKLWAG